MTLRARCLVAMVSVPNLLLAALQSDVFSYNADFSNPHRRVKISTFITHKDKVDAAETRVKVDDDRKHLIEATIVRIMKARKNMDHQNLISEVIKTLYNRSAHVRLSACGR